MTYTLAYCSICHNRCQRKPDGHCGYCRAALRRRDAIGEPVDYDPEIALTGGEWVKGPRGIMHWRPGRTAELEAQPDAPYNPDSRTCRRCRRPMRRGKRHRVPDTVWHASNGYCEACFKRVRNEQRVSA